MNREAMVEQFLNQWHQIHRHLRRHAPAMPLSITRVQWMMLRHLQKAEGQTIGGLADQFGVRPSTISQMIDRLERDGWVKRSTHEHDARVKMVHLTEQGVDFMNRQRMEGVSRMGQALDQLPEEDVAQLIGLLMRLSDALNSLDAQA